MDLARFGVVVSKKRVFFFLSLSPLRFHSIDSLGASRTANVVCLFSLFDRYFPSSCQVQVLASKDWPTRFPFFWGIILRCSLTHEKEYDRCLNFRSKNSSVGFYQRNNRDFPRGREIGKGKRASWKLVARTTLSHLLVLTVIKPDERTTGI